MIKNMFFLQQTWRAGLLILKVFMKTKQIRPKKHLKICYLTAQMPRGQTTIRGELTGGRDFCSVISGFRPLLASLVTEQLDTSTINDNYLSAYWPISEVALFVIQIIDIQEKYTSRYRVSLEIVFQVSLSLFRACAAPSMHYCLLEIPWCKARFCYLAKFFFR